MRRSVLWVLVLVVGLAACRVDATVTVRIRDDGSGTVTARVVLDADAVRVVETGGVKLEDAVRLGDLTAAGWESSGWRRAKTGAATLTVSKEFARAEDASVVVDELNGPDGPLRDVQVRRDATTFRTEWSFTGVADLSELKSGVDNDADLVARLTAERVDTAALDQHLLIQTRDALRLRVVADLPDAPARSFRVPPGASVGMRESSSQTSTGRVVLFVAGFAVGIIALVIFVVGEARDRRRRHVERMPRSPTGLFDDRPD